jgi:hypothetical protein
MIWEQKYFASVLRPVRASHKDFKMPKTEADFPLDGVVAFELLRLATIYHEQANASRKEGARLASCVMLGATVEAMLIAVINLFCEEARPVAIEKKLKLEDLLRWDFGKLLDVAKDAKLLPEKLNLHPKMDPRAVKDPVPTDKIREVRNLVHPGRYLRERGGKEITQEELDTLYATCHAAYAYLGQKFKGKYPDLPTIKTTL